jgi:hypothetical protein
MPVFRNRLFFVPLLFSLHFNQVAGPVCHAAAGPIHAGCIDLPSLIAYAI